MFFYIQNVFLTMIFISSGQKVQDPTQVWIPLWSWIYEFYKWSFATQERTQGFLHRMRNIFHNQSQSPSFFSDSEINEIFTFSHRLNLKCHRLAVSSSTPLAAAWVSWLTWTQRETLCMHRHPPLMLWLLKWKSMLLHEFLSVISVSFALIATYKYLKFSFRYPLKFVVEGVYNVKLYPEDGETTTILNIKRGIISALAVPLLEEEKNKKMVHG